MRRRKSSYTFVLFVMLFLLSPSIYCAGASLYIISMKLSQDSTISSLVPRAPNSAAAFSNKPVIVIENLTGLKFLLFFTKTSDCEINW